jgi:hypothetical protein
MLPVWRVPVKCPGRWCPKILIGSCSGRCQRSVQPGVPQRTSRWPPRAALAGRQSHGRHWMNTVPGFHGWPRRHCSGKPGNVQRLGCTMYGIQTYDRYTWTISQNSLRCQLCPHRPIVAGPAGRQFESGMAGRWLLSAAVLWLSVRARQGPGSLVSAVSVIAPHCLTRPALPGNNATGGQSPGGAVSRAKLALHRRRDTAWQREPDG